MFLLIADWHALDERLRRHFRVAQNTIEIVTDYLAAGLDPKTMRHLSAIASFRSTPNCIYYSRWSRRSVGSNAFPHTKKLFENVKDKDLHTYGFLGYPCLQTADIVIYSQEGTPIVVPVGEDQVSHVELVPRNRPAIQRVLWIGCPALNCSLMKTHRDALRDS